MKYVIESLHFLGREDKSMKGINTLRTYFVTPTVYCIQYTVRNMIGTEKYYKNLTYNARPNTEIQNF